jgi:O-antigen/teichoic acid export membrane protein
MAAGAYWIFGSMDRWLLAELSDMAEVGLFSIAVKFAGIIAFMMTAFGSAWSPFAYRLRIENPDYRAIYAQVSVLWFFFLAIAGLGIGLFSSEVLRLFTPASYWPAAPVVSIVATGLVLYGTTTMTCMGFLINRRSDLLSRGAWSAAACNVAANLLFVPYMGAIGAALATCLTYALLTAMYFNWSQTQHEIPLCKRHLVLCVTLTPCAALTAFLPTEPNVGLTMLKGLMLVTAILLGFQVGILRYDRLRAMISDRKWRGA